MQTPSSKWMSKQSRTADSPDRSACAQDPCLKWLLELLAHAFLCRRLGTSHIDSLVVHDLDLGYGTREQCERYLDELGPAGGGGKALADLRSAGTISAVGCGCNHFVRHRAACQPVG